jgi:hypothetical protein
MILRFTRKQVSMWGTLSSIYFLCFILFVNGCGSRHRLRGDEFYIAVNARWPHMMTREVDTCVEKVDEFESIEALYAEYPSAGFDGCVWGEWEDEIDRDVSTIDRSAGCWMSLDALVPGGAEFCEGGWASFITSRDRSGLGRSGVRRRDVSVRLLKGH